MINIELINEEASQRFAAHCAQYLIPPMAISFGGEIGTGKTTLVRAMLRSLGITSAIKSPTFSLVESYVCADMLIHHFDLYRIHHEEELDYLGFRDYFSNRSICCIEWPEHAPTALPKVDICFKLEIKGAGRLLQISAGSSTGEKILACLAGE